jgi:hypothetical protein
MGCACTQIGFVVSWHPTAVTQDIFNRNMFGTEDLQVSNLDTGGVHLTFG